ncbi:MAG: LptF/LptG family permease, partial [Alphaproteobacteria bacterium]
MTRLVMFGILFRYFTKRYLAWVLLCLVCLTAVVSLIDTVELIRRVSVLKTGIDVNFGLMTLLNIPNVMSVVLPFALLSGSMLCF